MKPETNDSINIQSNTCPDPALTKYTRWFVVSAGVILAITGTAKVWTSFAEIKLLGITDPVLGIKYAHLILVVGLTELLVAAVCLFSRNRSLASWLVAALTCNFLAYRISVWWMNSPSPCSCLGNLSDALHLSPETADDIMKVVLAYLLLGSSGLLVSRWKTRQTLAAAEATSANPGAAV